MFPEAADIGTTNLTRASPFKVLLVLFKLAVDGAAYGGLALAVAPTFDQRKQPKMVRVA